MKNSLLSCDGILFRAMFRAMSMFPLICGKSVCADGHSSRSKRQEKNANANSVCGDRPLSVRVSGLVAVCVCANYYRSVHFLLLFVSSRVVDVCVMCWTCSCCCALGYCSVWDCIDRYVNRLSLIYPYCCGAFLLILFPTLSLGPSPSCSFSAFPIHVHSSF